MIFSVDLHSTNRNIFILKSFKQFTCTNLDGCQEEGGNFFNLLQKEGVPRNGKGFPQKRGGGGSRLPDLEKTMQRYIYIYIMMCIFDFIIKK